VLSAVRKKKSSLFNIEYESGGKGVPTNATEIAPTFHFVQASGLRESRSPFAKLVTPLWCLFAKLATAQERR
jgi:hypothetical protein